MNKLLYIPLNWQQNGHPDLFDAFCEQFNTLQYSNTKEAIEFNPHYVYVQCGAIDKEILLEIKEKTNAKVIQWTGNCVRGILDEVLIYKDIIDVTFLASGIGQKDLYEVEFNTPIRYLQHGASKHHFREVKQDLQDYKVRFIGNAYAQFDGAIERNELCETLSNVISKYFEVWGNGFADGRYINPDSIAFNEIFDLYNKSYIGISANCMNDIEGYWSNRPLNIMASGSCCLMRYTPNMEKWFKDMEHCVYYKSNEEALEKIQMLVTNHKLRNHIAIKGQEQVRNFHTYSYRAIEMKKELKLLFEC